jgi:regulator of ribosome biosynthesis
MGFMATLPKPTYILPREKPVPKAKAATRWEKFAKAKGIQKRKRERMVYDEATGEYKPRYGFGGINQVSDDWLMEVPDNVKAGDEEDQYEAAKKAKKDRVAKNEKQRVRNLKEAAGIKDIHHVPKSKDTTEKQVKESKEAAEKRLKKAERKVEAEKSMHLAGLSTASMGRFDKKLEGEPKLKGIKRKFEATVTDSKQEKDSSLRIADKVVNGKYDPVKAKKEKNSKLVNVRKAIKANKSKE